MSDKTKNPNVPDFSKAKSGDKAFGVTCGETEVFNVMLETTVLTLGESPVDLSGHLTNREREAKHPSLFNSSEQFMAYWHWELLYGKQ